MKSFNANRKKETLKIKLAEIIRRENHPILSFVTIADIIVDKKIQKADIIFSCFGADPEEAQKILNAKANSLRSQLFIAANIKNIPPLKFYYNKGLDHAEKIERILSRLSTEENS